MLSNYLEFDIQCKFKQRNKIFNPMKKATFTLFQHERWLLLWRLALMLILTWGSLGLTYAQTQIITNYSESRDTSTFYELTDCSSNSASNSTVFTDDNTTDGNYADDRARTDTATFCPVDQWHHVKMVFTDFDLAKGDTLFAFQGDVTALNNAGLAAAIKAGLTLANGNAILTLADFKSYLAENPNGAKVLFANLPGIRGASEGTGSGFGIGSTTLANARSVSDAFGGWIDADCDPAINPSGCLTFIFATNGDRAKGSGWEAWVTCESRDIAFEDVTINSRILTQSSPAYAVITLPAPRIVACGTNVATTSDSVRLVVRNQSGIVCIDTLLTRSGVENAITDTFAIGIYAAEYTLLSDREKKEIIPFTVQAPALACNDKVDIPFGSACLLFITPDVILESPADTIADTMYYNITIMLGTGANQVVKTTQNFDNHGRVIYPHISLEDLEQAGMSVCDAEATVMIERIYYGLGLPTFCNNGVQRAACQTIVSFTDKSKPFIMVDATLDTLIACDTTGLHNLLAPSALDNCDKDIPVTISVEMQEPDICFSGQGSKDTTKAIITFLATDDCGNVGTLTREVVIIRPNEREHIVKVADLSLDCTDSLSMGAMPALAIGKLKNGQFVPQDTIPLSTEEYICGYILTSRDLEVPTAACGRKLFRYWSVVDWCSPEIGVFPIDTQFIKFTDKKAPVFKEGEGAPQMLNVGVFDCSYDITSLRAPEATDNCSTPLVRKDSVFRIENGQLEIVPFALHTVLDVDSFYIRWIAEDDCPEQQINDTLMQLVVIKDVTLPTAICSDQLNISIGSNVSIIDTGDIDLGSYDACGIVKREISRDGVNFGPTVAFSCEDIKDTIQVTFRVTDASGNTNACWVTVLPEDKIKPVCVPLPVGTSFANGDTMGTTANVIINCDDIKVGIIADRKAPTAAELAAIGGPLPAAKDNCINVENVELTPIVLQLGPCGQDVYQRRWIARDIWGLTSIDTCTQTITINYVEDWQINFPEDLALICPMSPTVTDSVEVIGGHCDRLAVSVESQMFDVVEGACFKVIKTYHIINWCTYNPGDGPTHNFNAETVPENNKLTVSDLPNFTYITYTQVIKVNDNEAPIVVVTDDVDTCITGVHDDPAFSVGDSMSCGEMRTFTAFAGDCVTEVGGELAHAFRLYRGTEAEVIAQQALEVYNSNGFQKGNEAKMSVFVLVGTYTAEFTFRDNCGNTTLARQEYTFRECRRPTPYLLNGLAIELSSQTASVDIWANDFDQGSYDNCTEQDSLKFRIWHISLGTNPPETTQGVLDSLPTSITFNCNYLGTQIVRIYVIDASDNFDYAATFVLIQDNMRACQSDEEEENMVAGEITSFNGETIEDVLVNVSGANQSNMITAEDGHYQFMLAKNGDYTIMPTKNDDVLNGVSTFDLVLISKHILGLSPFDSPYKHIAADVNRSGSITAFDMVQLRQLILNVHTEFPNNQSWRFVDKAYQFGNNVPTGMQFDEVITIQNLQENLMQTDFVGVKIGDVNGNATTSSLQTTADRNTPNTFNFQIKDAFVKTGETIDVPITALDMESLTGYQFTLDFGNLELLEIEEGVAKIKNFNTALPTANQLTTSWNGVAKNEEVLFNLVFKATNTGYLHDFLTINSDYTSAEAYDQAGNLMQVAIEFETSEEALTFHLNQNAPNPFQTETMIGFTLPIAGEATLKVMDIQGRTLKTIRSQYEKGYNQIYLDTKTLGATGVFHYQLEADKYIANKKMIIIE